MTFQAILDRFRGVQVLVVGDLMLDEYILGHAARISPEAPVMVVRQRSRTHVPGGAANVARNVVALGGTVRLAGLVGADAAGHTLRKALVDTGIGDDLVIDDPDRATTLKTRVLAGHAHQVLRIDHESDGEASDAVAARLASMAAQAMEGCGVLILSDYLKGTLTESVAKALIDAARSRSVPVVVNPKPRSLAHYRGASLVSLNRAEAAEATERWSGLPAAEAPAAGRSLMERHGVGSVLVTLGEDGMCAVGSSGLEFGVRAPRVEVYDTAGAGDTVVATVALGLAAMGMQRAVFELAAQTAASVVRHVGVQAPSAEDLAGIVALGEIGL